MQRSRTEGLIQLLYTTSKSLNLIEPILEALRQEGHTSPTPIQEQPIPILFQGEGLLGCTQTDTGKAAAFSTPISQKLHEIDRRKGIEALVLIPTQEPAIQAGESFETYSHCTSLKHAIILSGTGQKPWTDTLQGGIQILATTPGKLLDLISRGFVSLDSFDSFALDEADRILGMGFTHDIKHILKLLPTRRQTLFFPTAILPEVETLTNSMLTKPERVEVIPAPSTADIISQQVYSVEKKEKKDLLIHLLKDTSVESVLIFTHIRYGADKLARILIRTGIGAEATHGNKTQGTCQRALTNFRNHILRALIATDIVARGIDVGQLSHVISHKLPSVPETRVHRIGQAGRAGHEGIAVSFCGSGELPYLEDIQELTRKNIPIMREHPFIAAEGTEVQEERQEEIRVKTKANKVYHGSRANGDSWRRKGQKPNQPSSSRQEKKK